MFPVDAGYDLFQTIASGTVFMGEHFQGVPLGTYDFGAGPVGVGNADTIIQRTQDVSASGGTTNLAVRALQLESVTPVDLGPPLGAHYLFITLDQAQQAIWQSTPTNNVMTISDTTFATSFFDVFFDVHLDSLTGTVIQSGSVDLSSSGNAWSNNAPAGAELIPGVNNNLNGSNQNADFWPAAGLHNGPHLVDPAAVVPEPTALVLTGIGGVFSLVCGWRKRRHGAA